MVLTPLNIPSSAGIARSRAPARNRGLAFAFDIRNFSQGMS